jgi:hypothetical protein
MPWFDLFVMRKEFLNLKKPAEKTASSSASAATKPDYAHR